MNFKDNYKNIIIGILFILFISACFLIYFLINNKEVAIEKDITGKVIIADEKYLMIESNGENYLISNIKGAYDVGDEVKFNYLESELDTSSNPKQIKIKDEELIKKKENIKEENPVEKDEEVKEPENNNGTTNNNQVEKPSSNNSNNIKKDADTEVLSYMTELETEMNKPSLGEKAKEGFITVVDFLFYKGTIKGYTFNELTNSAKLKVLSMALYFDEKIDKYFPGYKESISNTTGKIYQNVKSNVVSSYLTITTTVCKNNTEICESAKAGFQTLKKNFGLTFELIKEIAGDGLTNLKNWYEIWSGK